jgi:hypothetical protein
MGSRMPHSLIANKLTPNYALERSVKSSSKRAAGAHTIIAPAARRPGSCLAAQRGR